MLVKAAGSSQTQMVQMRMGARQKASAALLRARRWNASFPTSKRIVSNCMKSLLWSTPFFFGAAEKPLHALPQQCRKTTRLPVNCPWRNTCNTPKEKRRNLLADVVHLPFQSTPFPSALGGQRLEHADNRRSCLPTRTSNLDDLAQRHFMKSRMGSGTSSTSCVGQGAATAGPSPASIVSCPA